MIRFTIFFYIYNPNCFNILLYNFFNMKEMINLEKYMENFYWYWNIKNPEIIFIWIEEGWNEPLKNILKWINENKNHIYFDIKNKNFTIDFFEFHKKFYSNMVEKNLKEATWDFLIKILCKHYWFSNTNNKDIFEKFFIKDWEKYWKILLTEIYPLRSSDNGNKSFEVLYKETFEDFDFWNNEKTLRWKYQKYIFPKRRDNLKKIISKASVKNIIFYWKSYRYDIEEIIWEKFINNSKGYLSLEKDWKKIFLISHPASRNFKWVGSKIKYFEEIWDLLQE